MLKRLIALCVCFTFVLSNYQPVYAQEFSIGQLPVPGSMVSLSKAVSPIALKGIVVNPQKPLEFQFIVDTGSENSKGSALNQEAIKEESNKLVKYFLAGLTIPEGDLWVNLSPYEKDRIVPQALGQTELGRDLLAQDYVLKQLTASLIYPEKDLGKAFWAKVYAKAQSQFGTSNIPVNTFNKVWILPNKAQVFENGSSAYVTQASLKVMLDEDYLATVRNKQRQPGDMFQSEQQNVSPRSLQSNLVTQSKAPQGNHLSTTLTSQIIREIVLPEIEKEVNTGKNFAQLRQIYQAMILAKWYKETIQNRLLDAIYTNKSRTKGVNLNDPAVKEQIYQRYLQAYKKGVFNYIKEEPALSGQLEHRKYFSGGITQLGSVDLDRAGNVQNVIADGAMIGIRVVLNNSERVISSLKDRYLAFGIKEFGVRVRNNVIRKIAVGSVVLSLCAGCRESSNEQQLNKETRLLRIEHNLREASNVPFIMPNFSQEFRNEVNRFHEENPNWLPADERSKLWYFILTDDFIHVKDLGPDVVNNLKLIIESDDNNLHRGEYNSNSGYSKQAARMLYILDKNKLSELLFLRKRVDYPARHILSVFLENEPNNDKYWSYFITNYSSFATLEWFAQQPLFIRKKIAQLMIDRLHAKMNDESKSIDIVPKIDYERYKVDFKDFVHGLDPNASALISLMFFYDNDPARWILGRHKSGSDFFGRTFLSDHDYSRLISNKQALSSIARELEEAINKELWLLNFDNGDNNTLLSEFVYILSSNNYSVSSSAHAELRFRQINRAYQLWLLSNKSSRIGAIISKGLFRIPEQELSILRNAADRAMLVQSPAFITIAAVQAAAEMKPNAEVLDWMSRHPVFTVVAGSIVIAATSTGLQALENFLKFKRIMKLKKKKDVESLFKILNDQAYTEMHYLVLDVLYELDKSGEINITFDLRKHLINQNYDRLIRFSKFTNQSVQATSKEILKEYEVVIKRLEERQPANAEGTLLKYIDLAYSFSREGYDFKVHFSPKKTEEVETYMGDYYSGGGGPGTIQVDINPERLEIYRGDKLITKDAAMQQSLNNGTKVRLATNGGIDLNKINFNRTGKVIDMSFDPALLNQIIQGGFEGFKPVITDFQFIQSPLPLLGVKVAETDKQLVKL